MPGLYFDEFEVGSIYRTPSRTITETDVVMFAAMSGDYNELHTSEAFGETTPFGKRLAHGLLILGISHGLMFRLALFDGTGLALLSVDDWKFKAPVFFGDTIHCEVAVKEKVGSRTKQDRGVVKFAVSVVKQDGTIVQQGVKTLMIRRRAEQVK